MSNLKKSGKMNSEFSTLPPVKITGLKKNGSDLLSHIYVVPSAQQGLTSLFGMERGGTLALKPPK